MNIMQNRFGIAIPQHSAELYQMKKAIEEILWHCTLKDKNNDYHHRFCPLGQLTWCKYQKHKLTAKQDIFRIPIAEIVRLKTDTSSNQAMTPCSQLILMLFGANHCLKVGTLIPSQLYPSRWTTCSPSCF